MSHADFNSFQEGHKWLNSVHRFNETPKPAIMAWETVSPF